MTDNILHLVPPTVGDEYKFAPDTILEEAKGKLSEVVVVGVDHDGMMYVSSSHNSATSNMLLDFGKAELLRIARGDGE